MSERLCTECQQPIPEARLKALPNTRTCVSCSSEQPVKGQVDWDGKHTPILTVVPADKFNPGRTGLHAFIGEIGSCKNPFEVAAVQHRNLSQDIKVEPPLEAEVLNFKPARCHPDRPAINVRKDCFECAASWYRRRRRRGSR